MKFLVMLILGSNFLFGQWNNKNLESKFEKEVLKEITSVINETKVGNKSQANITKKIKNKFTALDSDLRILCRVRVSSLSIKSKIKSLGCEIKNETHNDLYVWIPYNKVEELATLDEVLSIGTKGVAVTKDEEVISAGSWITPYGFGL